MLNKIIYKELSYKIMGAAMEVHNELGTGFLEKVYENSLVLSLKNKGLKVKQQYPIKVKFSGKVVGDYIADVLVEDKLILELKILKNISNIHKAQAFNYLKATGLKLAIIINFKKERLETERVVL